MEEELKPEEKDNQQHPALPSKSEIEEDATAENEDEGLVSGELIPRRGCLKGCLIPVVTIFVIIMVLIMIINVKRNVIRDLLVKRIISNTQKQLIADLPKDADKIKTLFDKLKTAFEENKVDEQAMERAIKEYLEVTKDMTSPEQKKPEIDTLIKRLNSLILIPENSTTPD